MSFRMYLSFCSHRGMRFFLPMMLCSAALLAGCGSAALGNGLSDPSATNIPALGGTVFGGQQPIIGATIQLYAAGTTGYGSVGRPLVNCTGPADGNGVPTAPCTGVTTGAGGMFTITNDYVCPPNAYVYIVANGGNSHYSTGSTSNSALALMAGLGACSALNDSTFISLNEVTTVASVTALQQFMSATYGTAFAEDVGAPASNLTGLKNAFATIPKMVNISTGAALVTGSSSAIVSSSSVNVYWTNMQSKINALGNILSTCVNSGDIVSPAAISSSCSGLFAAAKPSAQTNAPADTIQAMLDLALNPTNVGTGATGPYSYVTGFPAFSPTLSAAPNDWTLSLGYYSGSIPTAGMPFLGVPYNVAIDSNGTAWFLNQNAANSTVSAISPGGAPYAYLMAGSLTSPRGMVLDTDGNVYVADYGSVSPYSATLRECVLSGATCGSTNLYAGSSTLYQPYGIAIDGNNNIFAAMRNGGTAAALAYVPSGSVTGTPLTKVTAIGLAGSGVAADSNGYIWVTSTSGSNTSASPSLLQVAPGCVTLSGTTTCTPTTLNAYTSGGNILYAFGLAIDANGAAWVGEQNIGAAAGNRLIKIAPSASTGTNLITTAGIMTATNAGGASYVMMVAVDGGNNVWAADNGSFAGTNNNASNTGSAVSEFTSAGVALSGANGFQINFLTNGATPTQSATTTGTLTNGPRAVAIDQSGNVWVANGNASSNATGSAINVNEIVGAAVPAVAPLALAAKNGTFGVRP